MGRSSSEESRHTYLLGRIISVLSCVYRDSLWTNLGGVDSMHFVPR